MTNQTLILKTLLESPKTTGEIAKALGKIDKNGNGKYNVVADDLKRLKKLGFISSKIEKKTGARGPPPTVYNIIYDVKTIIDILNSHNSLLTSLQKNDKIIDLIIEKQKKNIIYDFDLEHMLSFIKSRASIAGIITSDITQSELQDIQVIAKIADSSLTDDFVKKTKLSPTFFKFFLENNTNKTRGVLINSFLITSEESKVYYDFLGVSQEDVDDEMKEFTKNNPELVFTQAGLLLEFIDKIHGFHEPKQVLSDCFFKACVNTDVINGIFNRKSLDFIHNEIDPFKAERKKQIDELSNELT